MVSFSFSYLIVLFLIIVVECVVDYCSKNTFVSLQYNSLFTKEPNSEEYATRKRLKGLHCCAKEYRSIEWFKDNRPYPWSATQVSQLILYPESGNQTIFATSVDFGDAGNYTCVIKYDTYSTNHTIELFVLDTFPSVPKVTHSPKNIDVAEGQSTRFFCEAFIGLILLPDVRRDIQWLKLNENGNLTFINFSDQIRQQCVSREDNQTLGSYLIFNRVYKKDFGRYVCRIRNPETYIDLEVELSLKEYVKLSFNDQFEWSPMILWYILAILMVFVIVTLFQSQFGLLIRVCVKDCSSHFQNQSANDEIDVMFCYSVQNTQWFYCKFVPLLNKNYSCRFAPFSTLVDKWSQSLISQVDKCKHICLLFTPESTFCDWQAKDYQDILKSFQKWKKPILIIMTKHLPISGCKNHQISTLLYNPNDLYNFYLKLRLRLPPKRFNF